MRIIRESVETPPPPGTDSATIPIGTVFDGQIGRVTGPFLRVFERIVNLENPRSTWTVKDDFSPTVHGYVELDATLTLRPKT